MESKKTKKADLGNRRVLFMELGFVVALVAVVSVFAVGQSTKTVGKVVELPPLTPPDIVTITRQPPPPPPVAKTRTMQVLSDFIKIRRNDAKIETDYKFIDPTAGLVIEIPNFDVTEKVEDLPVVKAETMPSFQGGDISTFRDWVQARIEYPLLMVENNRQGKVVVKFVIERDGTLTNIEELASPDPMLTEEVTRVLRRSPPWSPGKQRNKAVRVSYVLPIEFRLN